MSGHPVPCIRRSQPVDGPSLVALWERSIRATHHFLSEADIAYYRPLVAQVLAGDSLEFWVLTGNANVPIGFLGLSAHGIEALFLEPAHRRRGWGRRLVAHAQQLRGGALTVDVNEENDAARRFYEALGFAVVGRSSHDDTGRPHPVLHLRRDARHGDSGHRRAAASTGGSGAIHENPRQQLARQSCDRVPCGTGNIRAASGDTGL